MSYIKFDGREKIMYDIAVVEDEDAAAVTLIEAIKRYGRQKNVGVEITRYPDAASFLKSSKRARDIVFMDILLPYMNGMDAAVKLRELDHDIVIVFVTNIVNFAVKGYSVGATGFIVKPITYEAFAETMDRAVRSADAGKSSSFVSILTDGAVKKLPLSEIYFIEVEKHNIVYHTEHGEYRTRGTLAALERELNSENFSRCNNCYLVNLKYVTEVKGLDATVGGQEIRISRARRKAFMNSLTDYLGKGA